MTTFNDTAPPTTEARRAHRQRHNSVLAYAAGGVAFSIVATILLFITNDFEFLPLRTTVVITAYSAPVLIMIGVVFGLRSSALKRSIFTYLGLFAILGILNIFASGPQAENVVGPLLLGLIYGLPSALLLALFNRRFRSMAPVLMIIASVAAVGALVAPLTLTNDTILGGVVDAALSLELGATAAFVIICCIGLVVAGGLGLKLSQLLADAYRRRRISDERLIIDSIWLFQSMILAWSLQGAAYLTIAAFAAYKLVSVAGIELAKAAGKSNHEPALLVLRVFASDSRSQELLDDLLNRWSYLGPVRLISAPDVARHTIDHSRLLLFIAGRLDELFIGNGADLEQRMASVNSVRDPDGRFRLEPFFCQGEIWRRTVRRLIGTTDVILMDLRGFDRTKKGCIYEIEALLDLVPLNRLLVLVDGTTVGDDLRSVMNQKWVRLDANSPNLSVGQPELAVLPATDPAQPLADQLVAFTGRLSRRIA